MFPKKTTTKKNTAKLKVLEPHKNKITKLKEGKNVFCFVSCWLELLRREIHTESKMVRLTLLVLDTVKHGMSRRRSVISIMVAHYKTGIQYLKLWHTKIYTNAVKPCYLKTQVNWDPPPLPFNISNIFIIYEIKQNFCVFWITSTYQ